MHTENIVETYTDIFDQLHQKMKWKVVDKRVLMSIAATYVMKEHSFQYDRFLSISDALKKEASFFSSLTSQIRFTIAAMLDHQFEQPEKEIPNLFKLYDKLIKVKMRRGNFTYITATVLLTHLTSSDDIDQAVHQTKKVYNDMQTKHPFLTSTSDYPLAALLAMQAENAHQRTEDFYEKLNRNGFKKGNELQLLSHILSIGTDKTVNELVSQTIAIHDAFKDIKIKSKNAYYSIMGMLALLPPEQLQMDKISQTYHQLNQQKQFKWQKDLNVMLAAMFFISSTLEDSDVTHVSLVTSIEAILQMQQAIIVSSTIAATVTSSSNQGSN